MGSRSKSGQRRRLEEARRVVREALGDAVRLDHLSDSKYVPLSTPREPQRVKSKAIGVLLITEAATRLGISTREMETMVARGKVKTVVAGRTKLIPSTELNRLTSDREGQK